MQRERMHEASRRASSTALASQSLDINSRSASSSAARSRSSSSPSAFSNSGWFRQRLRRASPSAAQGPQQHVRWMDQGGAAAVLQRVSARRRCSSSRRVSCSRRDRSSSGVLTVLQNVVPLSRVQ